ncbi:MAG: alpha-amylase family glycosyl hydrolase [Bacteroidota bacterium]
MFRRFLLAALFAGSPFVTAASSAAQVPLEEVTEAERAQGYALRGESVVFVFDAALYDVQPERVAVTGAFRGWSTDMEDEAFALATDDSGLWTLTSPLELSPASPFKFRVDAGRWLDPHVEAPNVQGGNLIYQFGVTPQRLVAELRGERSVWVELTGTSRPFSASAYRVVRWDGEEVPVELVTPHEAHSAVLTLASPLATNQVHYVEATVPEADQPLRTMARFDGLWRDLASSKPLGTVVSPPVSLMEREDQTMPEGDVQRGTEEERWGAASFRLFVPRADSVHLHLYDDRVGDAYATVPMEREPEGTWHLRRTDVEGDWYDFSVFGPDGPGSAFTNQTGETVSDPYALVNDDSWGRARVWYDTFDPPSPVRGGRPAMEDVVAYEVHVQDFADRLPVEEGVGALEAFGMPGLRNSSGQPIGLDYLTRLGINVVHLMPIQEYLHYPDDAWQAAFADDPFMQEQGIADENYQWGYRTTHALAVESRFRSAGDEPGAERERFRDLVDALHQRGMAVIVDVVFNHTGENMEGVEQLLTFNGIDKHYYYRLDEEGEHIGVFGNEVKSENRPMTQRWLLDQLRHYVEVFGVDGFRIDLAGQTDEQTLRWLQAELGEDVLIYGEPWIASNDPDFEANPSWDWYKIDSPITFFQDDARNAFKGSPGDDPTPDVSSRGFSGGDPEAREATMLGIANDYPEEPTPNAGINYLDIHDNWALPDRFASCMEGDCAWDGRQGVLEAEMRIGAALLMTSLGPIVIHGGTEIARSKGLAPLPEEIGGERVLTDMEIAPIYIKGRGDTYNLRTANHFLWETIGTRDAVDFIEMERWWTELIRLRLGPDGEVLRVGEAVPEGYVQFLESESGSETALGYIVGDQVMVLVNVGEGIEQFRLPKLDGVWVPIAISNRTYSRIARNGLAGGFESTGDVIQNIGGGGVSIWVRRDGAEATSPRE